MEERAQQSPVKGRGPTSSPHSHQPPQAADLPGQSQQQGFLVQAGVLGAPHCCLALLERSCTMAQNDYRGQHLHLEVHYHNGPLMGCYYFCKGGAYGWWGDTTKSSVLSVGTCCDDQRWSSFSEAEALRHSPGVGKQLFSPLFCMSIIQIQWVTAVWHQRDVMELFPALCGEHYDCLSPQGWREMSSKQMLLRRCNAHKCIFGSTSKVYILCELVNMPGWLAFLSPALLHWAETELGALHIKERGINEWENLDIYTI